MREMKRSGRLFRRALDIRGVASSSSVDHPGVGKVEEKEASSSFSNFIASVQASLPAFLNSKALEKEAAKEDIRARITLSDDESRLPSRNEMTEEAGSILGRSTGPGNDSQRLIALQKLCDHLLLFPEARRLLVARDGAIPALRAVLETSRQEAVQTKARQALALLGYAPPLKGRGIRLLSIDGGGTRGLMTLELLGALEAATGKRIYELFDMVVGVSTGAIIATLLTSQRLSVAQARDVYREMSMKLFNQSRVYGVSGLLWEHSYYDTKTWVGILKGTVGEQSLVDTARLPDTPKLCFVSCVVNRSVLEAWVFRNFHQPGNRGSCFSGGVGFRVWEALQASSAAPGYFKEVRLGPYLHQDGGVLANNPTSIGIHEAKVLWGADTPLECVVSVGNGRCFHPYSPAVDAASSSWKDVIVKMVDSATDTEMTHMALNNVLPCGSYFRFNPYSSETYLLDEIDPARVPFPTITRWR